MCSKPGDWRFQDEVKALRKVSDKVVRLIRSKPRGFVMFDYYVYCVNEDIFGILQEHLKKKGYSGYGITTQNDNRRYLYINQDGTTDWNSAGICCDGRERLSIEEVLNLPKIEGYGERTVYSNGCEYVIKLTKDHVEIPGLTIPKIGLSKGLILAIADEIRKEEINEL